MSSLSVVVHLRSGDPGDLSSKTLDVVLLLLQPRLPRPPAIRGVKPRIEQISAGRPFSDPSRWTMQQTVKVRRTVFNAGGVLECSRCA